MREDLSQLIYKELINGSVINKEVRSGDHLVPHPLFNELAAEGNRERYCQLYRNIGYDLKQLGDCFFINEMGKDEVLSDVAMRIQVLLVVICRGITQIPLLTSVITDFHGGLSKAHIESIGEEDEYLQILKAVGFKGGLSKEVENVLINRKLAYWNHFDRLVLSNGGVALLEYMQGV